MPAESQISNIGFLILLNSVFISLVLSFSIIIYLLFAKSGLRKCEKPSMSISQLKFNVKFVSYSTIIGFFLILFDRIFIRGINYSLGLRAARYQWLNSTGGSPYGIIGNLLIPFGFICIFFLIVHKDSTSKKEKRLLTLSSFIGIFGHAALNGGRSNILLAIFMVIISLSIGFKKPTKLLTIKPKNLKIIIILSCAIFYVGAITYSSAIMNNMSIKQLTSLGLYELYGVKTGSYNNFGIFGEPTYFIIYFLAYLYHGQWTAQVTYSLPIREGSYTFYSFGVILEKLGLIQTPLTQGYFSKTGAFISLPGAFYYDFGFWGVILLSIILGGFVGLVLIFINKSKFLGGIKLAFIYYILFIIYLSPILPAYGLMYLNFIVFSFVSLEIINRLIFKVKTNWLTGTYTIR